MPRKKGFEGITNPITKKLRNERYMTLAAWCQLNDESYGTVCQIINGYRHNARIENKLRRDGLVDLIVWKNGKEAHHE